MPKVKNRAIIGATTGILFKNTNETIKEIIPTVIGVTQLGFSGEIGLDGSEGEFGIGGCAVAIFCKASGI